VVAGDVALALASSGLHSNGYSLVRKVFADAGWAFDREVAEFGRSLGEELLTPTRVYARDLLAVIRAVEVHSISHITGGGLANNLVRVLPAGISVDIDRSTWAPPAVFELVQKVGGVSQPDVEATLNQGVGMVMLLPLSSVAPAQKLLTAAGIDSWIAGSASASSDGAAHVQLRGSHAAH
jgi:phosphoribosylformylglycinamidine cyclo-ligase